jgi:hypothetical protein
MCDDDDVPLFTEETFRRYKVNLAATATVKAATGMSDDDNDVPLFDEKARTKHAASLHATGMSDDNDAVPLFDEKARAKHAASLHWAMPQACRSTRMTLR